jgi:hypothetical protein
MQEYLLDSGVVSFFDAPIQNTYPNQDLTLKMVFDMIKSPVLESKTKKCWAVRNDKEALRKAKNDLSFITPNGVFSKRAGDAIVSISGFIAIDIDGLDKDEIYSTKETLLQDNLIPTALLFTSPSGMGLKWIVPLPKGYDTTINAYKAISNYLKLQKGIEVDPQGGDLARACYLCWDKSAFFDPSVEPFSYELDSDAKPMEMPYKAEKYYLKGSIIDGKVSFEEVEYFVRQIENQGLNIAHSYDDWLSVGLCLCSCLGVQGRALFHRISCLSDKYDPDENEKKYNELLKSGRGVHGLGTLFHLASAQGFQLASWNKKEDDRIKVQELSTFADSIGDMLPSLLKEVLKGEHRKDLWDAKLLASLAVLGSRLNFISGSYDGNIVYPNLFCFIIGPPASGKGRIADLKGLINPIHVEWQKAFENEYQVYLEEKAQNPKTEDRPPLRKVFRIAGNNSSSGFLALLSRNDGKGIILESEADTLVDALKKEYGNFSDLIRKAFHHETCSYYRKTDDESLELEKPRFSVLLTGTKDQFQKLVPSAENGTFSRYVIYHLTITEDFKNPFNSPNEDWSGFVSRLGIKFHEDLKNLPFSFYSFHLSAEYQNQFTTLFQELYGQYKEQENMNAVVKRHGLIAFRILMILSFIELLEQGRIATPDFNCTENAFNVMEALVPTMLEHAHEALTFIDNTQSTHRTKAQKEQNIKQLYNALPDSFKRKEYIEIARKLNIAKSTAERYLDKNQFGSGIIRKSSDFYLKEKASEVVRS